MKQAIDYIHTLPEAQEQLCLHWHHLVADLPGISSPIKYGIPFYYRKKWICYLNPQKDKQSVELVFLGAQNLSNESDLLDFRGRQMVAGFMLHPESEIPWDHLLSYFHESLLLEEK